jgi:hypothetical protein
MEPEVPSSFSQSPPSVRILSQTNPVNTIPSYLSQILFNVILVGCILLRYVYVYFSNIPTIATENLLVLLFLSVNNMFRPLRAIFR